MNVIAEAAATRAIWTIITTHSPTIAERIPSKHLKLVVRAQGQTKVIHDAKRHLIASVLGTGHSYSGMAIVEDDVARDFAIAILDEFSPDLLRQLEVVVAGGESKISAALSSMPASAQFRLVGLYDGDQREALRPQDFKWPWAFLPGLTDPAAILKEGLQGGGAVTQLVGELRRDAESVMAVLSANVGVEPRDWIIECVRALAVSKSDFVRALTRVWLQTPHAGDMATSFVTALTKAYDDPNER
jgi:hypothetical protein